MLTGGERGAVPGEQLALDFGVTGRERVVEDAWWVRAVEDETEGDQDTGWWDA